MHECRRQFGSMHALLQRLPSPLAPGRQTHTIHTIHAAQGSKKYKHLTHRVITCTSARGSLALCMPSSSACRRRRSHQADRPTRSTQQEVRTQHQHPPCDNMHKRRRQFGSVHALLQRLPSPPLSPGIQTHAIHTSTVFEGGEQVERAVA